mgnify:FL=1
MSKKQKIILGLTILLSSCLFATTMFRSGLVYDFGVGFWGPNGHDGIWHLALINQLAKNIPPQNPVFSGTVLNNYHWGFDLFVSLISTLTSIKPILLYFQIFPFIFAVILGLLSFKLVYQITQKFPQSLFFVLLNYFASSFGWIITLIKNRQIGGESMFWSMQSVSTLLNPPFAFSLIILLSGLILWHRYKNGSSVLAAILIGIIFSLLSGIKVYSGVLIGFGLSFYWLVNFLISKKFSKFNFFICLFTGVFSFTILCLLGVFRQASLLEFKPLWFIHSMIESIDKFYWPKLASYRYNQTNSIILLLIDLFLITVFLVGNLGTRICGIFKLLITFFKKKNTDIDLIFIPILTSSFLIPLLFVQKGTAWNTIQFFYYFLFIANFYFASFLGSLWGKQKKIVLIILLLSCLGSYGTLKDYFGNPPPSALPLNELAGLNFLKNQPEGIVLTYPYDKYLKNNFSTPIPLYAYETTAYTSAFSQKIIFLEDEMNLDITGFDWQSRRNLVDKFFHSTDKFFTRGFLVDNDIKYIYLVNDQKLPLNPAELQVNEIYNQSNVKLYQVQR